jgi:hypothetical protein
MVSSLPDVRARVDELHDDILKGRSCPLGKVTMRSFAGPFRSAWSSQGVRTA